MSASGVVTDGWETFSLEYEVAGGACGAAHRGGVSHNASKSNLYRIKLLGGVSAEYRARSVGNDAEYVYSFLGALMECD